MTDRPRRRPVSTAVRSKMKQIEERLARLEEHLNTVRREVSRSSGEARVKLDRIERALTAQITRAQTAFKDSLDRVSAALAGSKRGVEHQVGLLLRGLKAGARAGSAAYRRRRRG